MEMQMERAGRRMAFEFRGWPGNLSVISNMM